MTEPKKQDGTMELDVNQIDLLDLPLPPRSKPDVAATDFESSEAPTASKGPPPLPPSLPPLTGAGDGPDDPPVPSLVLPEPSAARATPAPPISARKLVGPGPSEQKSPIGRFLIGMGGATLLCVAAWFGWKATHKAQAVPPAATSAAPGIGSGAGAPMAPTHAFTMAPIEFTAPVSSSSAPEETPPAPSSHASATATHAAATAAPTTTTHATATATTHPTAPANATTKPPRTDELIKVEN